MKSFQFFICKLVTCILALMILSKVSYAQKVCEFDYAFEYKETYFKDSIPIKKRVFHEKDTTVDRYYLTNSRQNHYVAIIMDSDSLHYTLNFKDENGIAFVADYLKTDLQNADTIKVKCEHVAPYNNPYKKLIKDYAFTRNKDTLINGTLYEAYQLASYNQKKIKKHKIGVQHTIIARDSIDYLPIFNYSTAYEEWKSERVLPPGLIIERYFIDYYGQLHSRERLTQYYRTRKKLVIDKDCDYTSIKRPTIEIVD